MPSNNDDRRSYNHIALNTPEYTSLLGNRHGRHKHESGEVAIRRSLFVIFRFLKIYNMRGNVSLDLMKYGYYRTYRVLACKAEVPISPTRNFLYHSR